MLYIKIYILIIKNTGEKMSSNDEKTFQEKVN